MAKKSKGGIPHPTLDKPKNMPGTIPSPAIGSMFGGKNPKQGGGGHKAHSAGGDFGGDQHGLHGATSKGPKMTSKGKKKKK